MVSAGTGGGMAGAFKDSGDERTTTRSTISAGATTIGSGDAASQAALAQLDRGATSDATAGKLAQGWDGQKLAQQAKLNAQIVAEFGAQAAKDWAGFTNKRKLELEVQARTTKDPKERETLLAEAAKWDEGGIYRVAGYGVLGGLGGGLGGAAGAAGALEKLGSPQRSSQIIPIGGDVVRFSKDVTGGP